MAQIEIEITNTTSTIAAPREIMEKLRYCASYQEQNLPPREVQRVLKRWHERIKASGQRRWNYLQDRERVYMSHEGSELDSMGWPADRWTKQMFESTLRNAGIWDGWKSAISTQGVFHTGLLQHVKRVLTLHLDLSPAAVSLTDLRSVPRPRSCGLTDARLPLGLWDHQVEACSSWHGSQHRGVWDLPPRSGKTLASAKAIADVAVPTVVIVPTVGLVKQTAEVYREIFGAQNVGEFHGSAGSKAKQHRLSIRTPLWVATPRTAVKMPLETRQMLVTDEHHRAAAQTYQEISLKARNAYYRLGLTGTHYRSDGTELLMHGVTGPKVYKATVADMVAQGVLAPGQACMIRTTGSMGGKASEDDYRNGLAVWAAKVLIEAGKKVLVICVEVAHTRQLADQIPGAVGIDGSRSKEVPKELERLAAGTIPCLVGTSVIGEGVDVPAADALVYACGSRSRVKVVQDVYRVLTASPGKARGLIVDFADEHEEASLNRAVERLHHYRAHGFEVAAINPTQLPAWVTANG